MTYDDFKAKHKENVLKGFDDLDGQDYWAEFKADLHTLLADERKALELQNDELRKLLDKVGMDAAGKAGTLMGAEAEVKELKRLNSEQQKVIDGCCDVLAQFCGESAPVIAHPPKCRFYLEGKKSDCNCTAKSTANDVMLSLKACRDILGKTEKP